MFSVVALIAAGALSRIATAAEGEEQIALLTPRKDSLRTERHGKRHGHHSLGNGGHPHHRVRSATLAPFEGDGSAAGKSVRTASQRRHPRFEDMPHVNDVVIDDVHKLIYVDNVKAGSSTMRIAMKTLLNATWSCDDSAWKRYASQDCCTWPASGSNIRTTTKCLTAAHDDYTVFSTVRHPVAKFESGVREAWGDNTPWRDSPKARHGSKLKRRFPTADKMLDAQLERWDKLPANTNCTTTACSPLFLNTHLEPNLFRLSGFTSAGASIRIDFVLRLEHMVDDLKQHAREHVALRPLVAAMQIKQRASAPPDSTSQLSPAGVAKFCASSLYSRQGFLSSMSPYSCDDPQRSRSTLAAWIRGEFSQHDKEDARYQKWVRDDLSRKEDKEKEEKSLNRWVKNQDDWFRTHWYQDDWHEGSEQNEVDYSGEHSKATALEAVVCVRGFEQEEGGCEDIM
jgi:hypothetical protein